MLCHFIYRNISDNLYTPYWCEKHTCVTLLAPSHNETGFVRDQINDLKLYIQILWLDDHLKAAIDYLKSKNETENFLFVYRAPSEIVLDLNLYDKIVMPQFSKLDNTWLKYSISQINTYYTNKASTIETKQYYGDDIPELLKKYNSNLTHSEHEDKIYCEKDRMIINIGGLFENQGKKNVYFHISPLNHVLPHSTGSENSNLDKV